MTSLKKNKGKTCPKKKILRIRLPNPQQQFRFVPRHCFTSSSEDHLEVGQSEFLELWIFRIKCQIITLHYTIKKSNKNQNMDLPYSKQLVAG